MSLDPGPGRCYVSVVVGLVYGQLRLPHLYSFLFRELLLVLNRNNSPFMHSNLSLLFLDLMIGSSLTTICLFQAGCNSSTRFV